ncbi:DctP family TRAP transporter solute-binding subunit [Solirhodobacter olei]|uniref:DctP family TRAP transporter solute-binding subunit n=1 Tax=Solirhodobacter olei TaxID=2493082 RepID=UPI000FDCAF4E|nr:DctP family TRAP transporter solute-binding subunit [Solirhodobacter olei]
MKALAAALVLALSAALPAFAGPCTPSDIVVKFATVVSATDNPKGIAAQIFADRVNREMAGKVCVIVYPDSTLYDDDTVLQAMLQGDVQLAAPSLSKFEAFTKVFRLFDLPFLFTNLAAVSAFEASPAGAKMKNAMLSRGLTGLEFWHSGMKQFSANRPLVWPADAKGLKFRIQPSDVIAAEIRALGAQPQSIAFSDVYSALKTGVVDGQENTWSNIYAQKFYKVQDGITETNHGVLEYLVVTSTDFLNSLPPAIRRQFLSILHQVTVERNAAVTQVEAKSRAAILAAGGHIRQLTPAERAAWVKAMQPVWAEFRADVGPENIAAAQAIDKRLAAQTRGDGE